MAKKYCPDIVTKLKPSEVYVFGSNELGFHGAGAAGYAQRGTAKNTWRQDKNFLDALKSPPLDPKRKGKWSVLGEGRGYQEGKEGASYAIATVAKPGRKRSVRLSEIYSQLLELGEFAKKNKKRTFLVTVGGGGLSGWTVKEMKEVFKLWCKENPPPKNVLLRKEYEFRK